MLSHFLCDLTASVVFLTGGPLVFQVATSPFLALFSSVP